MTAVKETPSLQVQKVRDDKGCCSTAKRSKPCQKFCPIRGKQEHQSRHHLVDDLFVSVVDDQDAYYDLFRLFQRDASIFNHSARHLPPGRFLRGLSRTESGNGQHLALGAMFHDIGMIPVDRRVLEKKGPLSRSEWDEIKKHPEWGYTLLKSSTIVPLPALKIVLEHHERTTVPVTLAE